VKRTSPFLLKVKMGADLVMAYNSDFDFRIMRQTAEAFGCDWPATGPQQRLYLKMQPELKAYWESAA
jgi:hypothetical protein